MHAHRFGLFRVRSPLLAESLLVFSSSAYLDVSVQRVCDYIGRSSICQVSPFGHVRINRSFAPPRTFSQLTTSFVASRSQGIPHAPLFASISRQKSLQTLTCSCSQLIQDLPTIPTSTPLSSPFYFYFSPSLVNELFDLHDPLSKTNQANDSVQYLW